MNTPIYDFVHNYVQSGTVRAHMPGHKGIFRGDGISAVYPYDITEIKGADALFEADGIIAESEKNAASLFGTDGTFYSAGGSTLCIQAMLAAVCRHGDRICAARNSHKALLNSCILLGLDVDWIYPEFRDGSVIGGSITAAGVENVLKKSDRPACVYITSPDYLGNIADIKGIAEVCRRYDVPLLVDNAHGAHLAFLDENIHPIALGADMCCDSAHKTLPVLTGGAYLHTASAKYTGRIKECMSLFGSSSPSYLILQSLDLCNKYLAERFRGELRDAVNNVRRLKERLSAGYNICDSEPLKLTIYSPHSGRSGYSLGDCLRERGVEPEYCDGTHVMLMFSTATPAEDYRRTAEALESIPAPRIWIEPPAFDIVPLKRVMSPREAYFSPRERILAEKCEGRICASAATVCPPCVPVAAPGEIFDKNSIKILKMYSIPEVNVVK